MAPPVITTSGPHFRDEVVIDGESSSTDSEGEVMVITPQSRKRKRVSAVVDEDGDDDAANRAIEETKQAEEEEDDDDDDVEIVQVGAAAMPLDGSASKKSRRLTIQESQDSDDAHEPVMAPTTRRSERASTPNRRHSTGGIFHTPVARATPGSHTSSARRSSARIEHKRQEKVSEPSAVRKLELVSLDNCLETRGRGGASGGDDDDFEDEDEDEDDVDVGVNVRRRGKAPVGRRETEREVLHADGDDDLDEFIVDDNEVEYMDDDENGVISVESGSDNDGDGDSELDDFAAVRAAQLTREPKEWFEIYLEYVEECILDADVDKKMRRRPHHGNYALYREAIHHVRSVGGGGRGGCGVEC